MSERQRKSTSDRKTRLKNRTIAKAKNLRNTSRVLTLCTDIQGLADALGKDSDALFASLETMELSARSLFDEAGQDVAAVETLNEDADFAAETIDDILHVWEQASQSFGTLADHALLLFESIQREENTVLGMKDAAKELSATVGLCSGAAVKIRKAAGSFDVAGLNMTLEAGKKNSANEAFAMLGGEVKKAADRLTASVAGIDALCAGADAAVDAAFAESGDIAERFRTVMVLAKSIGNTFGELSSEIETLFETAEKISVSLDENIAAAGILEDAVLAALDAAEELEPSISFADGSLEETKDCADLCADFGEELTIAADRLEDDSPEQLDEIRMLVEDFASLSGSYGDEFDLGTGALDVAAQVMARLAESKKGVDTVLAGIADNTAAALDALRSLYGTAAEIGSRFESTSEAFDGFIQELDALRGMQMAAVENLETLDTVSLDIIGATDLLRESALRASFFAVTGKLEALRADKGAEKYSAIAAGLEEVSASLETASDELADAGEVLGSQAETNAGLIMTAHKAAGIIESTALRDELADIRDSLILPAGNEDLVASDTFDSLAGEVKELVKAQAVAGKNIDCMKKKLDDAGATLARQKDLYEKIRISSEKLGNLLDEVETGKA